MIAKTQLLILVVHHSIFTIETQLSYWDNSYSTSQALDAAASSPSSGTIPPVTMAATS
jgi:hypothetical protein